MAAARHNDGVEWSALEYEAFVLCGEVWFALAAARHNGVVL